MKIKLHLLGSLCLQLLVASRCFASAADHRLDVYWIDSEGGGSTLIVTPSDESMLIDTGNPGTRDADRIFVFDGGHIVETGRFDELVARGGRFLALARSQLIAPEAPAA